MADPFDKSEGTGDDLSSTGGIDMDSIRGLLREEARDLLSGMQERFAASDDPLDPDGLEDLAARGHTIKGSAAMAELHHISRVGAAFQFAAELAQHLAAHNATAATALVASAQAAWEPAWQMVGDAFDSDDAQQELAENVFACFGDDRERLERSIDQGLIDTAEDRAASTLSTETMEAAEPDGGFDADSQIETESDGPTFDPELAASLADVFRGELTELLANVPDQISALVDPARQAEILEDLGRVFHTVKGSAATVGQIEAQQIGLVLQDGFEAQAEAQSFPLVDEEFLDLVEQPLGDLFLAAGLEPPAGALEMIREATRASMVDADDGAPAPATLSTDEPVEDEDDGAPVEPEIMEAFSLDAEAALEASETALLQLEKNPNDDEPLSVLFRQFHTLKGAGAAVGLKRIAAQLHAGESLLEEVIEEGASVDRTKLVEVLLDLVDSVAGLLAAARGIEHEHQIIEDVEAHLRAGLGDAPTAPTEAPAAPAPVAAPTPPAPRAPAPEASTTSKPAAEGDSAIVRVHASRLDLLMGRVSELVVSRTRIEDAMSVVQELKDKLNLGKINLAEAIEGFRGFEFNSHAPAAAQDDSSTPDDFTDLEFDKYDDFNVLARTLVELAADTAAIVDQLSGTVDILGEESRQVSKVTSSLQRTITSMRLVAVDTLFRRLARPVRDAARQEKKRVEFVTSGGEVQLDRGLVEALYGPLLHIVRNSVSHGVEAGPDRLRCGKTETGRVEISAVQHHGSVEIRIQDDGRGLDYDAIRNKGVTLGLIPADADLSRDELGRLIFRPGFSTKTQVTGVAGRGIGMDVVAGEVEQLRGTVAIESEDGRGTLFRVTLPIASAIDQVLLLRTGAQSFALSQGGIETVVNVDPEQISEGPAGLELMIGDTVVPALPLDELVGTPSDRPLTTAVVFRAGTARLALLVECVEAQREAVIRPLGRLFASHPFITSGTFAGDGQVLFVLDPSRLAATFDQLRSTAMGRAALPPQAETVAAADAADDAVVLWADDSISVRKLAELFLTAEGLTAETAVDGRDALEKLRRGRFQVVVTDLEMPHMHGYELLHEIRQDPTLQDLPVIVCSSRSSDKHRRRAQEAGASGYLTKPFSQEALSEAVRQWL